MNKPVNADKPVAASKPHYSVKARLLNYAARMAATLSLSKLFMSLTRRFMNPAAAPGQAHKPVMLRPISLKLGVSRRLSVMLLAIALMAQCALLYLVFLPLTWPGKLLLWMAASLLVAWMSWQALRLHAWRQSKNAVLLLTMDREGSFSLSLRDGRCLAGRLQASSVVFASLTLLNFRLADDSKNNIKTKRMTCLILPDAVAADEFRRLRIWLRWGWLDAQTLQI